jgi:hypothetical protein
MPRGQASSFHLVWRLPAAARAARLVEASAVLEVLTPPSVPTVYFWALQVDFVNGRGVWGGGHTGVQWNPRYPGGTAVNWGGYAARELGGAVLEGTISDLPGFADDPHTLAYAWLPSREYRFRVYRSPEISGAWRAEVTDVLSGEASVIRDLLPAEAQDRGLLRRLLSRRGDRSAETLGGGHLVRPIVWSEVFAECDAPSVSVRWSDLRAVDENGAILRPEEIAVSYQSAAEGGCSNTSVAVDSAGILQITNTPRVVDQGTNLVLPDPRR